MDVESKWSKEKELFVFGPYAHFMSLEELQAMNDNGLLSGLIKLHQEGRPISRQDAEHSHRGTFGILPSCYKEMQWEKEH